jgi:hypothetical protein
VLRVDVGEQGLRCGYMAEKPFEGSCQADKRARCEDYFSEDEEEERPEKRMRSEEWLRDGWPGWNDE